MKDYFSYIFNRKRIFLVLMDQSILFLSVLLSYIIRLFYENKTLTYLNFEKVLITFFIISPFILLFFYIFGIYERWEIGNFSKSLIKIFFSLVFITFFTGFIFYFIPHYFIGRVVFVLIFSLYLILLIMFRFFFFLKFEKNFKKQTAFFLGVEDKFKNRLLDEFSEISMFDFKFVEKSNISEFLNKVEKQVDKSDIIVISLEEPEIKRNIKYIIELKFKGFFIYDFENFYMSLTGKVFDTGFKNVWQIVFEQSYLRNISSYYKVKRIFDFSFSLVLLFLLFPVFIIVSILIKITSKGPVFFIQERLGWHKKPFKLIKFRTMVVNAEKGTGPKWAEKKDPRITFIGRFLRLTRLDEVPQLINVLKGDMSLIGNRPIRKYFADKISEKIDSYDLRFFVKPGLTGWSQVKMGYVNTFDDQIEKLRYELFYIKNMSFIFDLIILLKTVKTVLNFKGK